MTNGDEDVGTEGRKRYLLQWQQQDRDKHAHMHLWNHSLILYSSGLEQYGHSLLNTETNRHIPAQVQEETVKLRQTQAVSWSVTVLVLSFAALLFWKIH